MTNLSMRFKTGSGSVVGESSCSPMTHLGVILEKKLATSSWMDDLLLGPSASSASSDSSLFSRVGRLSRSWLSSLTLWNGSRSLLSGRILTFANRVLKDEVKFNDNFQNQQLFSDPSTCCRLEMILNRWRPLTFILKPISMLSGGGSRYS